MMLNAVILVPLCFIIAGQMHKRWGGELLEFKYFKPFTLTWWVGAVPLIAGLIVGLEPLHQYGELVQSINNVSGNLEPSIMVTSGLAAIGLRGKDG